MRSRERQSEIMDWIERSKCHVCAVNETGLTGEYDVWWCRLHHLKNDLI